MKDNFRTEFVETILERFPYRAYFEQTLSVKGGSDSNNLTAHCPFHDDTHPSFSVCIAGEKRGVVNCFSPACGKTGDIFWFIGQIEGLNTFDEQKKRAAEIAGVDPLSEQHNGKVKKASNKVKKPHSDLPRIPLSFIDTPHHDLLSKEEFKPHLDYLQQKRGWELTTIKLFRIGYTAYYGGRYTIPIFGRDGDLQNILYYKPGQTQYAKYLHHQYREKSEGADTHTKTAKRSYYRPGQCFTDWEQLASPDWNCVVIAAGPMDAGVIWQHGFPMFSGLTGEGSWSPEFNSLFSKKIAIIAYDNDKAGVAGANKVLNQLTGTAEEVRLLKWPSDMQESEDITDYFVKYARSVEEFTELVEQARSVIAKSLGDKTDAPNDLEDETPISLHQALRLPEHYMHFRKIPAVVSATSRDSLTIPVSATLRCSWDVKCSAKDRCPVLQKHNTLLTIQLKEHPKTFMAYITHQESEAQTAFKQANDVPIRPCVQTVEFSKDVFSAVELEVSERISTAGPAVSQHSDTVGTVFYTGSGRIKENGLYTLIAKPEKNPRSHKTTIVAREATPELNHLETFVVDDAIRKILAKFRPASGKSCVDHIQDIASALSVNICKMIDNLVPTYALLTTVFTPINFYFAGQYHHRGWGQTLLIGDQGSGKSESIRRYNDFCPTFEMIEGSNTSLAGMTGGMFKGEHVEIFRQGVLQRNDLGMVVIDEYKKLPKEVVGALTGVRSEGIIRYTKLIQRTSMARVRLLLYSSPPGTKELKQFKPSIAAAMDMFHGSREDVRRLDNIFLIDRDLVSAERINSVENLKQNVPSIYTAEDFKILTSYAWTRDSRHIWFESDTEKHILSEVLRLAAKYTTEIPLIDPKSYRFKLAKMAIMSALICGSVNETEMEKEMDDSPLGGESQSKTLRQFKPGELLIIKPEHVDAYLKGILEPHLDSDHVGLLHYARKEKREEEVLANHSDIENLFYGVFQPLQLKFAKFMTIFADRNRAELDALRVNISPEDPIKANLLFDFLLEKSLVTIHQRELDYYPKRWDRFIHDVRRFYLENTNAVCNMEAKYTNQRQTVYVDSGPLEGLPLTQERQKSEDYKKEDDIEFG